MRARNLVFLHIPKAAGTTLHSILERHYPRSSYFSVYEEAERHFSELSAYPEKDRKKIRLLKGHFAFGVHRYLEGPSTYITLLRNPIDRVISHYFYVKRTQRHYLHQEVTRNHISLEQYVSSHITEETDNGQVRLLCGVDRELPYGGCGREHLEIAKRNVETHFAVAGISERFDESLALMAIKLGWEWAPYYLDQNVTQNKTKQIDSSVLEKIRQENALDLELYEWARIRFEEELAAHQDEVARRMDRLRRANRVYRPIGRVLDYFQQSVSSKLPHPRFK